MQRSHALGQQSIMAMLRADGGSIEIGVQVRVDDDENGQQQQQQQVIREIDPLQQLEVAVSRFRHMARRKRKIEMLKSQLWKTRIGQMCVTPPGFLLQSIDNTVGSAVVSKMIEEAKCPICYEISLDMWSIGCNAGHALCGDCLNKISMDEVSMTRVCPTCRGRSPYSMCVPACALSRLIGTLPAKCLQGECGWNGDISRVKEHFYRQCPHTVMFCQSGCGIKLERRNMPSHVCQKLSRPRRRTKRTRHTTHGMTAIRCTLHPECMQIADNPE